MSRFTLLFVLLATSFLCGCHHKPHGHEAPRKLLVTTPLRKSTELTSEYVAQVRAIQHIELRALERGYIQSIFVDEGQQIKTGERMFQILPLIYQAEVQKAQAEADAKANIKEVVQEVILEAISNAQPEKLAEVAQGEGKQKSKK